MLRKTLSFCFPTSKVLLSLSLSLSPSLSLSLSLSLCIYMNKYTNVRRSFAYKSYSMIWKRVSGFARNGRI